MMKEATIKSPLVGKIMLEAAQQCGRNQLATLVVGRDAFTSIRQLNLRR